MASLRNMIPPGGEKASGLDGDLRKARRSGKMSAHARADSIDSLGDRRGGAWVVDFVILLLIAGAVTGSIFLYRYLRDTYAPVWEEVPVVWTLELKDLDPELISYDRNGDMVLLGKAVYSSEREDADRIGTVTDVQLTRHSATGQPDTVTLYLTVESDARYRPDKGYWMTDTRLLCGEERTFRLAGLEAQGCLISLYEASELESGFSTDTEDPVHETGLYDEPEL